MTIRPPGLRHPDGLLGHLEGLGGEHRPEDAEHQVEPSVLEVAEIGCVALLESAVGQAEVARPLFPASTRLLAISTPRTLAPSRAAGSAVVPSPHPRSRTSSPLVMPSSLTSASPLSLMLSAMRVKSPFSQSALFAFMPCLLVSMPSRHGDRTSRRRLVQSLKRANLDAVTGYGQFCPVSKAAEVLCQRWTPLILRELLVGSTRFNEIRRGVPTCSPALLSKRLKELEAAGVVERTATDTGPCYTLTEAGAEVFPLIQGLGVWGQRWARSDYGPDDLDPGLLLWDVRRYLTPGVFGERRVVIQLSFPSIPARRRYYWIVADADDVDLCLTDPGFAVDLVVEADLRALTEVWMGDATLRRCSDRRAHFHARRTWTDPKIPGLVRSAPDTGQCRARLSALRAHRRRRRLDVIRPGGPDRAGARRRCVLPTTGSR